MGSFTRKGLPVVFGLVVVVACYGGNPSERISDGAAFGGQGLTEGVSGRVVSARSNDPIAGAAVIAKSLDDPPLGIPELGVDTGADGRYEWPLRSGRYAITIRVDGFKSATRVVRFGKGEVATLDFVLGDP